MNFVKGIQWRQGGCDTVRLTMKQGDNFEVKAVIYERTIDEYKELILCKMDYENYDDADKAYRRVVESFDQIYDEFGNEIEEDYK
nr:MAG TPA: 116 kDa U5 small nuclear ribonucleoprotein component [Caudoviricetes sp.]